MTPDVLLKNIFEVLEIAPTHGSWDRHDTCFQDISIRVLIVVDEWLAIPHHLCTETFRETKVIMAHPLWLTFNPTPSNTLSRYLAAAGSLIVLTTTSIKWRQLRPCKVNFGDGFDVFQYLDKWCSLSYPRILLLLECCCKANLSPSDQVPVAPF